MKDQSQIFQPIPSHSLKAGDPAPCRLFIYLQSNNRYIPIANEWQILDVKILQKISKAGAVYGPTPLLHEQFPSLLGSAHFIAEQLNNIDIPTFQRASNIRQDLTWIEASFFSFLNAELTPELRRPQLVAIPHIVYNALATPKTDFMATIADFSEPLFKQSLDIASTTCLLAMWLGYCEKELLTNLTNAVFCSEVGLFSDSLTFSQEKQALGTIENATPLHHILPFDDETFKQRYHQTVQRLKAEPLFQSLVLDHRLTCIIAHQNQTTGIGDPLSDILLLSRWFYKMAQGQIIDLPWHLRSFTKLIDALDLQIFQEDAAS